MADDDQALVSELMNRIDAKGLLQGEKAQTLLVELLGFALGQVQGTTRIYASDDATAYHFTIRRE